jgi:hypothetical protein
VSNDSIAPLEFLQSIVGDQSEALPLRIRAAEILAPYLHKKMPTMVEASVKTEDVTTKQLKTLSADELVQLEALLLKTSKTPITIDNEATES